MLILCSMKIFSQAKGVGLNIQVSCESDISDDGTSEVEIKDTTMVFGGSYHYFKNETWEYKGALFIGSSSSANGVSETKQTFFGLDGGVNYHILKTDIFSSGIGGRLCIEGYFEPKRTPGLDYDHYFKSVIALELPIFLDVSLNEKFLLRFSAVAAGFLYDIQYEEADGVKETVYELNLYSTTTSNTTEINWFPVSIYFIYKL